MNKVEQSTTGENKKSLQLYRGCCEKDLKEVETVVEYKLVST